MKPLRLTICTMLLALLWASTAFAIPAQRLWRTHKQSDGKEITYILCGDEHWHYYMSADSFLLKRNPSNGDFEYLQRNQQRVRPAEMRNAKPIQQPIQSRSRKTAYTGKKKGLFILVEFDDIKFSRADIKAVYDSICNMKGYHTGPFVGSVHDYFLEQSDGKFDLTFDVVGPVTMSKSESYYGSNSSWGVDVNISEMVLETLNLVKDSVDFSQYDWNGDGIVDQVFLLYAGYGEAQYAPEWTIWPCEGKLSNYVGMTSLPQYNGMSINTFACSCELHSNKGSQLDGIGTICHEFSHCMGLPDFYNTSDMTDFCMDAFELMDQGAYNGSSYCPAAYTGYERWVCGWREPVELKDTCTITGWLPLVSGGETYILYNEANRNEYYFIDNRERVGFDNGLLSTGLVAVHVDYNADAWSNNAVNANKKHKRMTLLPADGLYDWKTADTDAWPYTYMNGQRTLDSLTDNSRPHPTLFNKNYDGSHLLHKPIYKIRKNEDMTMDFVFGYNPVSAGIRETPSAAERRYDYIYDLEGRRILLNKDQLRCGIYIVNGKKIIINGYE